MCKHYAERDIDDDRFRDLKIAHMDAMITEDLHSKAAIAAELAVRDLEVLKLRDKLKAERQRHQDQLTKIRKGVEVLDVLVGT